MPCGDAYLSLRTWCNHDGGSLSTNHQSESKNPVSSILVTDVEDFSSMPTGGMLVFIPLGKASYPLHSLSVLPDIPDSQD
jgi:hypothetical protein